MYNASTNEGIIITLDANSTSTSFLDYTYVTSTDNIWTQHAAISAHCNATKTYTYFDTTFNWNSINGKGCNIISLVNIVEEDGSSMENAFWNGQAVFYGNGGNYLKPLAGALDVTAHELSHGVVATTANLEYYGQSGAINESFADIFACMVDRFDWTIGEDITKEGYSPSGFIRDLSAPHNMGDSSMSYWQPAHMSEIYRGTDDNAGIHINSGICNHAFYLFAVQTGKEKAEQVYFRALSEYLTKTSDFIDLRLAVVQSAKDLYGDGSDEAYYAAAAFEAVGIYEESAIDKTQDYQPNPGTEMLLTYDTNPNDPVAVYVSTSGGTGYRPLTNTPMRGKISVTDDGSKGVFVSGDRRLRMINVNSPEINETIISGYAFYDNVAISKDGKRLAATKGWADGSIYLVDLVTGEGRQFILYNPTTSPSNIDAGGVLKAYSIEFDITGEYLIYDAYNVINSNSLKDIYYWDIGFVKVWDNKTNGFGNGKVSKLFTTLPANVNVANPVFSKNSPYIIAFDYFYDDGIIEEYAVYGANLETGAVNSISSNDRLGYPSYSTNDDRIAYNTINGLNMQVVKSIKLKPDKISPAADPGVLVPDAKWPVFFTSGTRPLGLPPVAHFTSDYKYGNFPLSVTFMDLSSNNPSSWSWSFDGGEPDCSAEQYPEVTFKEPGFYDVTLITENAFGSDTIKRETYIHVINPVGTSEIENIEFQVFPNPVMDKLTISGEKYEFIKIFDMQGDLILYDTYKSQLDLSHFRPGIYILELENGNTFYRQKLIKQ
jgi:PKD repeat protein